MELDRLDAWVTLDLHGGAHKRRPELDAWVMQIAEGQQPAAPRTKSVRRRGGNTLVGGVAARGERRQCSDDEGQHVGIRGVAGGGAPGDRGVPCREGLGGVWTGIWRSGARTTRGGGWRRKGIGGVALRSAGVGTGWWSCSGRGTLRVVAEVADTLSAKSAHGD
jgi:hypothetical protein